MDRAAIARAVCPLLLVAGLALAACDTTSRRGAVGPLRESARPSAQTGAGEAPTPAAKPKVGMGVLDYFLTVAVGAEYGSKDAVVSMWTQDVVLVHVNGTVNAAGRTCLNRTIADFNALTATTDLRLSTVAGTPIELYFAPVSKFTSISSDYVAGNDGFFFAHWYGQNRLTDAKVLVRSTGISDTDRCFLIRQNLTRAMGLMRDTDEHPDSIFYSGDGPAPTRYSALDKQVISLLYSGAISPGFGPAEVRAAVTVA